MLRWVCHVILSGMHPTSGPRDIEYNFAFSPSKSLRFQDIERLIITHELKSGRFDMGSPVAH